MKKLLLYFTSRAKRASLVGRSTKYFALISVVMLSQSALVAQTVNMTNGSSTTCSSNFYDSGGSGGNYSNYESYVYTYTASSGQPQLIFSSFNLENYYDYMYIYNGPTTSSTLMGTWTSTNSPGTITGSGSSLTIRFTSDGSVTYSGWAATFGCLTPCTNPASGGTTVASITAACTGQSFLLSLSGASYGTGLTYQWQSSSNGSTWTNISGATASSYSATQTTATYYRCRVICSSGTPAYSTALFMDMSSFLGCYCQPTSTYGASSGYYGAITNVEFNMLNNSSSWATTSPYYTEYPISTATTVVFTDQTYPLKITAGYYNATGAWIDWNQDGAFGTSEYYAFPTNSINSYVQNTVDVTVPSGAIAGTTKMRIRTNYYGYSVGATESCNSLYYGEAEDYFITVVPTPQNDAGIGQIVNPGVPTCDFDSVDITVSVNNWGIDTLTSCDIKWQINSGTVNTYSFTGSVAGYGAQVDTVVVGNANFSTNDVLTVWTENPNGVNDSLALNDTATITTVAGLSGTFTIPGDYATFNDAKDDLVQYGVCDDVIFNVAAGTYTEQVSFPAIIGTSADATITFQSASGNTNSVVLTNSASYTVNFNGGDWITFSKMRINNASNNVVSFTGESDHITFNEAWLKGAVGTSSSQSLMLMSSECDNLTLSGNRLEKGSNWLYSQSGGTSNYKKDYVITDNLIKDQSYGYGYIYYVDGLEMHRNTFANDSAFTYGYGYMPMGYWSYVNNFNVTRNYVAASTGQGWYYGAYMNNCVGSNNPRSQFANNCIMTGTPSLSSSAYYGVYMYGTGIIDFYNNSIVRNGTNSTYAVYIASGGSINLKNNNFYNGGPGNALYVSGGFSVNESDYNNFYTQSGALTYFGSASYNTLEDHQNGTGQDAHSVNTDPSWVNAGICVTCNDTINGAGVPLATITDDIDGNARSLSTPDIGAVEYVTPGSFTLGGDDTLCGDQVIIEAGPAQSIAWGISVNSGATQSFNTPSVTLNAVGNAPTTFDISVIINTLYCGNGSDQATIMLVPGASLDSSLHICADETGTLAPGGGGSATYAWSTGESTSTIDVTEAGTYSVVKSELGCESEATVEVTKSVGVSIADVEACEADGPVSIDATIPDGSSYAWSGGGSNNTAVNTFTADGSYTVTATDNFGCVSSDQFGLLILGEPIAAITITATAGTSHFFSSATSQEIGASTTYSWLFDNTGTSTLANPSYTFPWSGSPVSYPVSLEVNNGCGIDSKSMNVNVDPLGVEETKVANSFSVYPNPAGDVVFVSSPFASESMNVSILDNAGRVVMSNTGDSHNSIVEINTSTLAAGTYMVKIVSESTSEIHTVIKQ
jgi:hypothetical protein